jgi:hypothetical protein
MSDSLQIATELKGIRAALDGVKDLKKNLTEAKDAASGFGDEAAEAMQRIREQSSDTSKCSTASALRLFSTTSPTASNTRAKPSW